MSKPDYDVFFYEAFEEEAAALKRYLPADMRAGFSSGAIQECGHDLPPAPVISIRTQSRIPGEWSGLLQAIISRSTGYDHLTDYRRCTGTTALLGYLPLYCARAVAEQAMLLWMALLRKLPQQIRQFETFHRDNITGRETLGKTLLVVGVGNIGGDVIRIGQGLGMEVLAVDPVRKHDFARYVDFAESLPTADIIVCAMNLTSTNRGFFRYDTLRLCKPGALFVNIARGDLLRLLEERKLGGVALDVYDEEKDLAIALRSGSVSQTAEAQSVLQLKARSDVICTPHNAFNTMEAVERKSEQTVQQLQSLRSTCKLLWSIPE